ncbi:MAG: hypothetical protein MZU84_04950 [Sphingobacterium sp.]|nr:hypothetical protein [Sphingobacterium sp.]
MRAARTASSTASSRWTWISSTRCSGGQYWLPYRQVISGRISVPLVSDPVIPFEAVTTFRDFEINTGRAPQFSMELPSDLPRDSARALWRARQDSLRKARREGTGEIADKSLEPDYAGWWTGGRFEVHRPPTDSAQALRGMGRFAGDRRVAGAGGSAAGDRRRARRARRGAAGLDHGPESPRVLRRAPVRTWSPSIECRGGRWAAAWACACPGCRIPRSTRARATA